MPVRGAITLAATVERLLALALELYVFVPVVRPRRGGPEQHRGEHATGWGRIAITAPRPLDTESLEAGFADELRVVLVNVVVSFLAPNRVDRNILALADIGRRAGSLNGGILNDPFFDRVKPKTLFSY